MLLADALRVRPGMMAVFTGAGGKTTALRRLVAELSGRIPVIVTTTTKFALQQRDIAQSHLIVGTEPDLEQTLDSVNVGSSVLLTGPRSPSEPKWLGLAPGLVDRLKEIAAERGAVVLVEADGARGRSLKAPATHEPVVPLRSDLVVFVVGMDALDKPLDETWVHRPELVGPLAGAKAGEVIKPEHVVGLVLAKDGGRKGVPEGADFRVLLNKVDDEGTLQGARAISAIALAAKEVQAVVLCRALDDDPVCEVAGRVAGIVLAAGGSTRLSRPKQTVSWRGKTLVEHAVRAAVEAGLSPVVVVLGHAAEEVRSALAGESVLPVDNPDWSLGQSTSIKAGLRAVSAGIEAAVFVLSDMPFVQAPLIRALIERHRRTLGPIVAPRVAESWASPVLFDRDAFPSLFALQGDRGGKALFGQFPVEAVEAEPDILLDVDTPEDLRKLEGIG